jgi:hypothetical protein
MCACAAPLRPLAGHFGSHLSYKEKTLPFTKTTETTSVMMTTRKESVISQDRKSVDEWTAAISRQVDLEGLVTEGYGYTVSITAQPPKPKQKLNFPSFSRSRSSKEISAASEIPMKTTEISIKETYQTIPCGRPNFWQTLEEQNSPSNIRPKSAEFITHFDDKPEAGSDIDLAIQKFDDLPPNQQHSTTSPDKYTTAHRETP